MAVFSSAIRLVLEARRSLPYTALIPRWRQLAVIQHRMGSPLGLFFCLFDFFLVFFLLDFSKYIYFDPVAETR
jgi:hypothetical protein